MAKLETKETNANVVDFLKRIADEKIREDCEKIAALMEKATGAPAKMQGASIVGFGERRLDYESGRAVDWMEIGFSPRKQNLTLYLNIGEGWDEDLLSNLGKHKLGKGCLSFKRLSDVDEKVLEKIFEKSVENTRRK